MANARSAKHEDPEFLRARRIILPAARANPSTRCRRCGRTLDEIKQALGRTDIDWDCGHPKPYAAECTPCNRGAGARVGNRNRHGNALGL